jgi:hypothetical protein
MSYTPNTNNINAAYAEIDPGFPLVRPIWTQNINTAYADISTAIPVLVPMFKTSNIIGSNAEIEVGQWAYYAEYSDISEITQSGTNNFIAAETLLKVPYANATIQQLAPELLTGVTYARLLQIADEVPEVSLEFSGNNITIIHVEDIQIDIFFSL